MLDVFKSQVELLEESDDFIDETCAGVQENFFVGILEVKAELWIRLYFWVFEGSYKSSEGLELGSEILGYAFHLVKKALTEVYVFEFQDVVGQNDKDIWPDSSLVRLVQTVDPKKFLENEANRH